jgi:hypothetical protein
MALTQADLDRIDTAIATAELEVQFSDGRRVRYRSVAEMQAARVHVAGVLASASNASAGVSPRTAFYPQMILTRERG